MNYIQLINNFWICNEERPLGSNAIALYFYLLKVCNTLGWKSHFKHSDRYIATQLSISVNTVRNSKNKLKQLGLIDFRSPQKPSKGLEGSTVYTLLTQNNTHTDTVGNAVENTVDTAVPDTRVKLKEIKQERVKEIPTNIKNPKLETKTPDAEVYNSISVYREKYTKSYWLETVGMKNKQSPSSVNAYFTEFCDTQELIGDTKQETDFRSHFVNWIKIEVKKNGNNSGSGNTNRVVV